MIPIEQRTGSQREPERPIATIAGLRVVGLPAHVPIIDGVSLELARGEILGIVGESGSGKTTLGLALLRYARGGTEFAGGEVRISGVDIAALSVSEIRRMRGTHVAYVPQSPATALNPALRIRTQLLECLGADTAEHRERMREVLREVALPDEEEFLRRYPHQLSGGQQQRIAIAMAFIARPEVIVLDEPTTGLDVATQQHVLQMVRELCQRSGSAAVYISHDLAVVAELSDRVAVLYAGQIVELGDTAAVLNAPAHPYTELLLAATPRLRGGRIMRGIPGTAPAPGQRPNGCAFAPRCPIVRDSCRVGEIPALPVPGEGGEGGDSGRLRLARCARVGVPLPGAAEPLPVRAPRRADGTPSLRVRGLRAGYRKTEVLHGIELDLHPGECLALLGESGSGKTTLSNCIVGLHRPWGGEIELHGEPLRAGSAERLPEQRERIQYVFQTPYDSLNPRRTVGELIAAPLRVRRARDRLSRSERAERVAEALAHAQLRPDHAERFPEQLSGGERQRVAIARALVTRPEILVCDEITSALDVSVQAAMVELLARLQAEQGLTLLFVTHNIALVRNFAQRIAVLERGEIVESAETDALFREPRHPYTRSIIEATPDFGKLLTGL